MAPSGPTPHVAHDVIRDVVEAGLGPARRELVYRRLGGMFSTAPWIGANAVPLRAA